MVSEEEEKHQLGYVLIRLVQDMWGKKNTIIYYTAYYMSSRPSPPLILPARGGDQSWPGISVLKRFPETHGNMKQETLIETREYIKLRWSETLKRRVLHETH